MDGEGGLKRALSRHRADVSAAAHAINDQIARCALGDAGWDEEKEQWEDEGERDDQLTPAVGQADGHGSSSSSSSSRQGRVRQAGRRQSSNKECKRGRGRKMECGVCSRRAGWVLGWWFERTRFAALDGEGRSVGPAKGVLLLVDWSTSDDSELLAAASTHTTPRSAPAICVVNSAPLTTRAV